MQLLIAGDAAAVRRITAALAASRFQVTVCRASTPAAFLAALGTAFDLIIADVEQAGFGIRQALERRNECQPDVPFLIVSNGIGDEAVAAFMRGGATDCLLNTALHRLEAVVERALVHTQRVRSEARARARHQARERHLRITSALSSDYAYSFRIEPDGTVIHEWVTGAFTQITGYTFEEVTARGGGISLIHPDDQAMAVARLGRGLHGEADTSEFRIVTKSGDVRWLRDSMQPEWDAGHTRVARIYGAAQDVTERRRAEEALRDQEKHFRALIENSADGISLLDGRGVVRYISPGLGGILGYRDGERLGHDTFEWIHPDDAPQVREAFAELLRKPGASISGAYRYRHRNGSWRWLESTATNLLAEPSVRGVVLNFRDATDRKDAEAARAKALRERENVMETIPDVLYTLDQHACVVSWNRRLETVTGLSPDAIAGRPAVAFFRESDRARIVDAIEAAVKTGYSEVEAPLVCRDGVLIPYQFTAAPLKNEDGTVIGLTGVGRDITESKRAAQRTLTLLDVANDISGTLNLDEILARVLRRSTDCLTCDGAVVFHTDPLNEETRLLAHHGIPPELVPAAEALRFPANQPFDGRLDRGETLVINDMRQQTWLSEELCAAFNLQAMAAAPLQVRGHGLGALVAFHRRPSCTFSPDQIDLLRGIAGQLAVAMESAALYRAQQDEAEVSAALARVGREMMARLSTPTLLRRLCELTTEMLACDYSHIWLWEPDQEAYRAAATHGDPPEHWEGLQTVALLPAMIAPLLDQLKRRGLSNTMMRDLGNAPLERLNLRHGITAAVILPLERGGEVVGLYTAGYRGRQEPFTARQERMARGMAQLGSLALESSRGVEELERINQLKSEFVATMSHELRTPLNIIMGYTDLLLTDPNEPLTANQTEALTSVDKSARSLLELITATLDMGRLESGRESIDLRTLALGDFISEVDAEVRDVYNGKSGVHFAWHLGSLLPDLVTDPLKLKIILKNLIHNAIKFTDRGSVMVRVQATPDGVEFAVADTGIGMRAADQRVIFDAFRQADGSSTRRYDGVGLGLYIVRRLVELLGGTITVESQVGRGSTFRVRLPAHPDVADKRSCGIPASAAGAI